MKYSLTLLASLSLSIFILAWCVQKSLSTNSSSSGTPTTEVIKIGVIAPISWPAANIWTDKVNVMKFATEEFNNSQTKYKIDLIIEDGKCSGKDAAAAAQKLVNIDQVKIILWGLCSSETLAAAKITEPGWVLLLSSVSSSPEISKIATHTYRYYNDLNQAATVKQYLDSQNMKNIAILYENTDYGLGFAKALTQAHGEKNVIMNEKFNSDEKDFSLLAKQVKDKVNTIEALIIVPNSDSVTLSLVRWLEQEWITDLLRNRIIWPETIASSSILTELRTAMEWVKSSQLPDVDTLWTQANTFVNAFKEQYQVMFADTFLVLYKEAFDLVAEAIADPNYWPEKVEAYIQATTKDKPISWLFWNYYFDGADVIWVNFVMKEVKNGVLVPVTQ